MTVKDRNRMTEIFEGARTLADWLFVGVGASIVMSALYVGSKFNIITNNKDEIKSLRDDQAALDGRIKNLEMGHSEIKGQLIGVQDTLNKIFELVKN